jgi:hypothetical protein
MEVNPLIELFPNYPFINTVVNILNDLTEHEVEILLKDPNFSTRFSRSIENAPLSNSRIEAYQLLVPYFYDNQKLAIFAVESNILAFICISPELRKNKDFIIKLLTEGKATSRIYPFLNKELMTDLEIVKLCLSYSVDILAKLAPVTDRDLILAATKLNGRAIQYASDYLLSDHNFKIDAVCTNCDVLKYLSETDKADAALAFEAVKQNGNLFRIISPILQRSETLILAAVNQINEELKKVKYDSDTSKFYTDFPELEGYSEDRTIELPF